MNRYNEGEADGVAVQRMGRWRAELKGSGQNGKMDESMNACEAIHV